MSLVEMIGDEDVFVISHAGRESTGMRPTSMCIVEIEVTPAKALIDTGASVNVMDAIMLKKLVTCPKVVQTQARIYTYGGTTPLPLLGVISVTVVKGDKKVRTRFHATEGDTGTLLGATHPKIWGGVFCQANTRFAR